MARSSSSCSNGRAPVTVRRCTLPNGFSVLERLYAEQRRAEALVSLGRSNEIRSFARSCLTVLSSAPAASHRGPAINAALLGFGFEQRCPLPCSYFRLAAVHELCPSSVGWRSPPRLGAVPAAKRQMELEPRVRIAPERRAEASRVRARQGRTPFPARGAEQALHWAVAGASAVPLRLRAQRRQQAAQPTAESRMAGS